MARGRMLNSSVSRSLKFHQLSDDTCRLLASWTIAHLDKHGVFCGDAVMVKSYVFPRRDDILVEQVESYLQEMEGLGLIVLFEAKGDRWQYWPGFAHNQVGLRPERESTSYPLPPGVDPIDYAQEDDGQNDSNLQDEGRQDDGKEQEEGKGSSNLKQVKLTEEGAGKPPTPPPKRQRRPRQPKKPTPEQQASRAMFAALASACEYDLNTITDKQRGQLNQSEKMLRKAKATPEDVLEFAEWWEENDWRGKRGEDPMPSQVREEWGRFKAWQKARREALERARQQSQPMEQPEKTEAQTRWDALAFDLSLQMTKATYDQWLAKAQAMTFAADCLTVQLESAQAKDWVQNRLLDTVTRTAERHGVMLEFVI